MDTDFLNIFSLDEFKTLYNNLSKLFDFVSLSSCDTFTLVTFNECDTLQFNDENCLVKNLIIKNNLSVKEKNFTLHTFNNNFYATTLQPVTIKDGLDNCYSIILECSNKVTNKDFLSFDSSKLYVDSLTSVYNRRFFDERLFFETNTTFSSFTLIILDVHNFKEINDNFGHLYGDKALAEIGAVLNRNLFFNEYAIRFGGDEFLVVLFDYSENKVLEKISTLRKEINATTINSLQISADFGYSISTCSSISENELINMFKSADDMMYFEKNN